MTATPLQPVPAASSLAGLTPEVLTVSALLSMPAVWTALVERELPLDVLLERFLIVLLTCALLAELVRRLGEGGALGPAIDGSGADHSPADTPHARDRRDRRGSGDGLTLFDEPEDGVGVFGGYDEPLALGAADDIFDAPSDAGTDLGSGLAGFDDLGDLAPLDLDADPFADPFADPA